MPEFLPEVPADLVLAALTKTPGGEVKSGKFDSPDSSSALVANAFGWFLERPGDLPMLPGGVGRAQTVALSVEMRFPWAGGKHPWLSVGVETDRYLIGVEAVRYEPFRPAKTNTFADGFERADWGRKMDGYTSLRRTHANGANRFATLDAVQLIKAAYGLRTESARRRKAPLLIYLYAEPATWANGRAVDQARIAAHRADIDLFSKSVESDEVAFAPLRWADLLAMWARDKTCAAHAARVAERFEV